MTAPAGRWQRFSSSSLAGRLTLFVMVLLVVALWLSAALFMRDRANTAFLLLSNSVADRIATIVPLMEATNPEKRGQLLLALDSPTLRVGLTSADIDFAALGWRSDLRHLHDLRPLLPDLDGRRILLHGHSRWRHHKHREHREAAFSDHETRNHERDREDHNSESPGIPGRAAPPPDIFFSRLKVLISVALRSGGWIHFVASTDSTSLRWASRTFLWLTGATVAIVVLSFWVARRMTRPLRRFADASEMIGLDIRAPPLPESGPRELRSAARAFNRMQMRLRRLIDDRTMMFAAIGHDLRTLLTRLTLRTEFIADEEQRQKASDDIEEMSAMLESTLSFARDDFVDAPRMSSDLAELLRGLCVQESEAGQLVRCDLPEELHIVCSPLQIKRALRNVLNNALRYGGEADVMLAATEEGAKIGVSDRGPGIPVHQREDVFRPFFRLEVSRNRETGGTGLGLAVARSIIRRHGGDIALQDRKGGGLVVTVTIPFADRHGQGR